MLKPFIFILSVSTFIANVFAADLLNHVKMTISGNPVRYYTNDLSISTTDTLYKFFSDSLTMPAIKGTESDATLRFQGPLDFENYRWLNVKVVPFGNLKSINIGRTDSSLIENNKPPVAFNGNNAASFINVRANLANDSIKVALNADGSVLICLEAPESMGTLILNKIVEVMLQVDRSTTANPAGSGFILLGAQSGESPIDPTVTTTGITMPKACINDIVRNMYSTSVAFKMIHTGNTVLSSPMLSNTGWRVAAIDGKLIARGLGKEDFENLFRQKPSGAYYVILQDQILRTMPYTAATYTHKD